jgi:hypothetical protein
MAPRILLCILAAAGWLSSADKYEGPKPPKPDVPFLLHATSLVETEAVQAREENRKNETIFVVSGASSPARTPLAEPIFIIEAKQIVPDRMELYRFEVKNGNREVSMATGKRKGGGPRPLHLMVTPLDNRLYKIEANEQLENGEYGLTPSGDNRVFCFQVY